jgi:hypothetical protein
MAFGPDLLTRAKLSAISRLPKIGMAWHPWVASRSQHHSAASLIYLLRLPSSIVSFVEINLDR